MKLREPSWQSVSACSTSNIFVNGRGSWDRQTKMPNFIGCDLLEKLLGQETSNGLVLVIPEHLHGASKSLVDALDISARSCYFLCKSEAANKNCVALLTTLYGS